VATPCRSSAPPSSFGWLGQRSGRQYDSSIRGRLLPSGDPANRPPDDGRVPQPPTEQAGEFASVAKNFDCLSGPPCSDSDSGQRDPSSKNAVMDRQFQSHAQLRRVVGLETKAFAETGLDDARLRYSGLILALAMGAGQAGASELCRARCVGASKIGHPRGTWSFRRG